MKEKRFILPVCQRYALIMRRARMTGQSPDEVLRRAREIALERNPMPEETKEADKA